MQRADFIREEGKRMDWTVIAGVAALVGLIGGIVAPMLKLNTSITELTVVVNGLARNFEKLTDKNDCAHEKINEKLDDHETRISIIEHSGKEGNNGF